MKKLTKRVFDITFSFLGLVFLSPLLLLIAVLTKISSKGPVFFSQERVGQKGKIFKIYKFRTMIKGAEKLGVRFTTPFNDPRITKVGKVLRKLNLDESPQLINILKGEMSFVGPRPEVPEIVALYNEEQKRVLSAKPGLTDFATLEFLREDKMMESSQNLYQDYTQKIMPEKIMLNLRYLERQSLFLDIKLIIKTILKIFSGSKKLRELPFLGADLILIILSVWLAFLLRFEGKIPPEHILSFPGLTVLVLFFCLPIFYFFHLYSFSWSYISIQELIALLKATTLGFILAGVFLFLLRDYPALKGFPRSTFFISYFLVFLFSAGLRFANRIYLITLGGETSKERKKRILIVGAGDLGEQILRNILNLKNNPYLPVGFVDNSQIKQRKMIHGIKVLGKISDIPEITKKQRIEELIIALPFGDSDLIKKAVEAGRRARLKKIKIVPSLSEIINGEVPLRNLREMRVEDLLGREPVTLNLKSIENFIRQKKILITGGAGSIGSELSCQVAKFHPSLLLILDQDETGVFNIRNEIKNKFPYLKTKYLVADVRDEEKINEIFKESQPNIVFHAAAYKHVPLMEANPDEAIKNNVLGTEIVANNSLKYGVDEFIFVSTDKAVNPTSVMGATKRVGEMICQVLNQKNLTKFVSVRFGNVLDSRGSVIPIFREQIKRGGPVEVTHPQMKRYFMTISEACLLIIQASLLGKGGEIFILDPGQPIKILDLAKEMIKLSGLEPDKDIPIVFTQPRPGEKFSEDILLTEENALPTQNKKIFRGNLPPVEKEKLTEGLKKLKETLKSSPLPEKIKNILKEIVPSYQPGLSN